MDWRLPPGENITCIYLHTCIIHLQNELMKHFLLPIKLLSREWRGGWSCSLLSQEEVGLGLIVLHYRGRGSWDHAQSRERVQQIGVSGQTSSRHSVMNEGEGELDVRRG